MTGDVLLSGVELRGSLVDCRVRGGVVTEIGRQLRACSEELVVRGDGGALLPGLADHHLHLAATAARDASLDVSAASRDGLAALLSEAVAGEDGWVRAVGYDDVAHGDLDRDVLDAWRRTVPVRVQHRSGALWVVNSAGLDRLGARAAVHEGVERDRTGRPTGRLWRADAWLREALGGRPPSLRPVGARLAAFGVTHVADATPDAGAAEVVADAVRRDELPQHVMVMAADADVRSHPRLSVGPVKLVVADHALPDLDELAGRMRQAHAGGRPVAVHCVTRTALALTLAAFDQAGGWTATGSSTAPWPICPRRRSWRHAESGWSPSRRWWPCAATTTGHAASPGTARTCGATPACCGRASGWRRAAMPRTGIPTPGPAYGPRPSG